MNDFVQVESFPVRLADDSWHRLGVVVSGDQIDVLLDCRRIHSRYQIYRYSPRLLENAFQVVVSGD